MANGYIDFNPKMTYFTSEKFINRFNSINEELLPLGYQIGLKHTTNGHFTYPVYRVISRVTGNVEHLKEFCKYNEALNDVYSRLKADSNRIDDCLKLIEIKENEL